MKPVFPSSMISETDPQRHAITGVPQAMASISTRPNGSGQSIGNRIMRGMEQGPADESSSVITVGRSWHVGEKRAEATEQQYCARRARVVSLPPSPIRLANNDESG